MQIPAVSRDRRKGEGEAGETGRRDRRSRRARRRLAKPGNKTSITSPPRVRGINAHENVKTSLPRNRGHDVTFAETSREAMKLRVSNQASVSGNDASLALKFRA